MATATSRARALTLYKQLLRSAATMPTKNRREYIKAKTRREYEDNMGETDPEKIEFLITLAEVQLESAQVQAAHLRQVWNDPKYGLKNAERDQ
ncbi:hypothetical protein JKP88DRAFT_226131 [Tribonema minus]|uniref:Complex 1 LYR protein domain-containing protein n=1 Tax=Tribonema minus TaxID=303371 RepID=A0A835YWE8_9STRA|nr:hypothetical protein JKP88DRAFT_226131 [Tribonema minus]